MFQSDLPKSLPVKTIVKPVVVPLIIVRLVMSIEKTHQLVFVLMDSMKKMVSVTNVVIHV